MVNSTEWEWKRYYMVSEGSETIIKRGSEDKYLSLRKITGMGFFQITWW